MSFLLLSPFPPHLGSQAVTSWKIVKKIYIFFLIKSLVRTTILHYRHISPLPAFLTSDVTVGNRSASATAVLLLNQFCVYYCQIFFILFWWTSKCDCRVKVIAHWVWYFAFFRIPHLFRSKCMLRMRKRRKWNLQEQDYTKISDWSWWGNCWWTELIREVML